MFSKIKKCSTHVFYARIEKNKIQKFDVNFEENEGYIVIYKV